MGEQQPLFEVIDESEYEAAHKSPEKKPGTRQPRTPKTEPRKLVTWWGLATFMGLCEASQHEEIQEQLSLEAKEYRKVIGRHRMVFVVNDVAVCRDCFLGGVARNEIDSS